jgi:hypothetical protein
MRGGGTEVPYRCIWEALRIQRSARNRLEEVREMSRIQNSSPGSSPVTCVGRISGRSLRIRQMQRSLRENRPTCNDIMSYVQGNRPTCNDIMLCVQVEAAADRRPEGGQEAQKTRFSSIRILGPPLLWFLKASGPFS